MVTNIKIIILAMMVTSCGAENASHTGGGSEEANTPASPTSMTMAITTTAELPACTATNENQLVYVKETKAFQTCSNTMWESIEIVGEKGEQGAVGAAGAVGEAGNTSLEIAKRSYFLTDSYVIADHDFGETHYVMIGSVEVTEFTSGYAYVSISGVYMAADVSFRFDFTHNSFMKLDEQGNGSFGSKIGTYSDDMNIYAYSSSDDTLTALNDNDNNVDDNISSLKIIYLVQR